MHFSSIQSLDSPVTTGSISFCGVGFVVNTMTTLHRYITDKKPDIERAVSTGNLQCIK